MWSGASVSTSSPVAARSSSTTPAANPSGALSPVPTAVPPIGSWASRGSTSRSRAAPYSAWVAHPPASWPSVIGTASMRCVRPALTTCGPVVGAAAQRRGEVLQRGDHVRDQGLGRGDVDRGGEHVVAALRGVDVVVRVHLDPEARVARVAITSLAFMFELCPTRSGTRRSGTGRRARPAATSSAAAAIAAARSSSSTPMRAFTRAAAPLTSPRARIWARSRPRPEIGKFSTARCVCARHNASAGTRTSPMVSCSIRNPGSLSSRCRSAWHQSARRAPALQPLPHGVRSTVDGTAPTG